MTDGAPSGDPTNQTTKDRVDTFGLALPPEWVRFPLEDGDFEEFVAGQRRRLQDEARLSRTAQRQFEVLMRQLRNDCRRSEVTMVAVMNVAIVDDDTNGDTGDDPDDAADDDADASLLAAACTISAMSKASLGSDLPLTTNTIAAAMGREPKDPDEQVEIVNLDPPATVEIPAGRAVKLVRLHTYPTRPDDLTRPSIFVQHFLVPYDDGEFAAVATFASPTPAYAQPLSGLFDQMMLTFRMFAGDEPTDPTG